MDKQYLEKIKADFPESEYELVVSVMKTITLKHVMANSQNNLDNTWSSILQLSKGDLTKLGDLVDAAKIDFRDVVYWASLENQKQDT